MNWVLDTRKCTGELKTILHSTLTNKFSIEVAIEPYMDIYEVQIWGFTKPSNIQIIQRFQNKVLRNIVMFIVISM